MKLSKHRRRKLRRQAYYQVLDASLDHPEEFLKRVHRCLDEGIDFAPDGHPVKPNFWHYFEATAPRNQLAARRLHQIAVDRLRVRPAGR